MSTTFAVLAFVALIVGLAWIIAIVDAEMREDRDVYRASRIEAESRRDEANMLREWAQTRRHATKRNGQPATAAHSAAASRQPIQYPKSLNDGDIAGRSQANGNPRGRRPSDER